MEGLGDITTYYVDLDEIARVLPTPRVPSFIRRVSGWLRMTWRSIPYFLGAQKSCDGFRNLRANDPKAAS